MTNSIQEIVGFISEYSRWTLAIIFLVSFGESFAFVSFIFPGTAIMVAAGTLIPSGIIPLWPVLIGSVAGATLGDFISYWIGYRFGPVLETHWPFVNHPHLLAKGHALFARHGALSIFVGRFLGPVRAVVPLVAGSLQMPAERFLIANIVSAIVWAPAVNVMCRSSAPGPHIADDSADSLWILNVPSEAESRVLIAKLGRDLRMGGTLVVGFEVPISSVHASCLKRALLDNGFVPLRQQTDPAGRTLLICGRQEPPARPQAA